jgi:hypothetical protein
MYAAFGDVAVIRRYFQLVTQGGLGDGMLREFYPGSDFVNEKTKIVGTIPQHALVWAARVWEYYWLYGDAGFLDVMYPTVAALAGWCDRHVGSDGLLERIPNWNWLDWSPVDLRGASLGTNAFYLHMLDDLGAMAEVLGRPEEAARFRLKATKVRTLLRERFWHDEAGVFCDSFWKGRLTGIASELGNGLALLFDIADAAQAPRIVARLRAPDNGLAPVTPLFHHYVLQGLSRAGCPVGALELMRKRFGPMMEISQTLWEGWTRYTMMLQVTDASLGVPESVPDTRVDAVFTEYRPCAVSLAHCGGVGAAFVLLTDILGIKPVEAGSGRCRISPCIGLLDHARGELPTRHGNIKVVWEKKGKTARVAVSLPPGVGGELELPEGAWRSVVSGDTRRPFERGMKIALAAGETVAELS